MDVRINGRDIYCSLKNIGLDYDSVYHTLKEVMDGEDFIFTQRNAGVDYLQWNLPQGQWKALDNPDDIVYSMVMQYIYDVKKKYSRVFAELGLQEHHVESIFTAPDNRYIYYSQRENSIVAVKLTAWGYKFPQKITSRGVIVGLPPAPCKQPVFVEFVYDCKLLQNYAFELILKDGTPKRLCTDDNGVAYIADITVDEKYEIKDIVSGNRYELKVEKDKKDYIFDVTRFVTIEIRTLEDGEAKSDVVCEIEYLGSKHERYTDENGTLTINVPYHPNEECVVNAMQMTQCRELVYPTTVFSFEEHTEQPEEPILVAPQIHVVDDNGNAVSGYPIEVWVDGICSEYVSSAQGTILLNDFPLETTIHLVDGHNRSNTRDITVDINHAIYDFIVKMQKEVPETPPLSPVGDAPMDVADDINQQQQEEPVSPSQSLIDDILIKVENYNKQQLQEGMVRLHQEGCEDISKQFDESGQIRIPSDYFSTTFPVGLTLAAKDRSFSPALMHLTNDEKEYILRIESQGRNWQNWLIASLLFLTAIALLMGMVLWLIAVTY